jgi:HSP20 family protein
MARQGTHIPATRGTTGENMPRPASSFSYMDRLFDEFLGRRWPMGMSQSMPALGPSVDVIDRDSEVCVRAEVPGFKKEDIQATVSGDTLTLSGHTKSEQKEEKGRILYSEIMSGSFVRTIELPAQVDDSKAKATIKDGVLELTLPKIEGSKGHTITIS